MHNPLEEFLKKAIFLMALGFWVSTTDTFKQSLRLLEEDHKVLQETRSGYDKMGSSTKNEFPNADIKTNTR
jgi:hypothetical protein